MKNRKLLEALGEIDEALIEEAAPGNKPPQKAQPVWIKWGAAACVLLLAGIGVPLFVHFGDMPAEKPESIGEPNSVTVFTEATEEAAPVPEEGAPLAPPETEADLERVSHFDLQSGLTGQRITVREPDCVQSVMDDLLSLEYEKEGISDGTVGYAYSIRFYNENYDDLGILYITEKSGQQVSYDGVFYSVESDRNICVEYLEELLKDAPPAEPTAE